MGPLWPFVYCSLRLLPVVAEEFQLNIDGGEFTDSEIIVMLGENGKIIS